MTMSEVLDNTNEQRLPSISYLIFAVTLTFGQRFVIPIGQYECGISIVVWALLLGYWLIRRQTYIHSTRLLLYLIAVAGILACNAFNYDEPDISVVKVAYMMVIYGGWIFVHHDVRGSIPMFRYYRLCMTIIALLGIGQCAIQVVGVHTFDPFTLLPEKFVAKGYYSFQPLSWGSEFYKSNGVFLFEPSYYSRLLAIALLIEILIFKDVLRMVLFGIALGTAFSGTGLIILIVLYPRMLMDRPKLVGGLTVATAILMIPAILLTTAGQALLGRSSEFSNHQSSAHQRFVAPYTRIIETFDEKYFLGHGSGTNDHFQNIRLIALKNDRHRVLSFGYSAVKATDAYPNTLITLIYELGLITGLPLLVYICYCFFRRSWSLSVSIALFLHLMFLAGDLTQVETVALCFALGFMNIRPVTIPDAAVREFGARHGLTNPLTALAPSVALR